MHALAKLLTWLVWVALISSIPATAYAQATIAGIVRDTSGAVLPGVTVEAASPAQIVYMPVPSPVVPAVDHAAPEKTASEMRAGSLLARDRSRFGTIATSFRGLLDLAGNAGKRKTLLGE